MEMLADEHPAVVQEVVYKLNAFGRPETDQASPELFARVLARSASEPEDLLFYDAQAICGDSPQNRSAVCVEGVWRSRWSSCWRNWVSERWRPLCACESSVLLALMARLSMPSEIEYVRPRLPEVYVNGPTLRTRILMHHPNRPALAREVIPHLSADTRN